MDENNGGALDLIRRKERELAERLKDAERRAKEKLALAEARAAEIRQEAESAGRREAEQFFLNEVARAREAAAVIRDTARHECEQLAGRGERCLDRAVQIVIESIFPK
ncbi:MAG TPA: V-type ATPase subunit subunit G family protein [Candidatus Acidoferrales bacterium]|nr:V-type ATPase subunit subunit G family protein [Candidatus Acidoferrales bacterium]